jgi:cytochrome c556
MSNSLLAAAGVCAAAALGLSQLPVRAADAGADAATLIHARQSSLMLSAATFGGMKAAMDSGGDVTGQAFAAKALARWARTLPTLFPEGTGKASGVATKAKDEVWTDRAEFEQRAAEYAAAADRLAELAQANDKAGFATQWGVVRQACSNCHDRFRDPPPAR